MKATKLGHVAQHGPKSFLFITQGCTFCVTLWLPLDHIARVTQIASPLLHTGPDNSRTVMQDAEKQGGKENLGVDGNVRRATEQTPGA